MVKQTYLLANNKEIYIVTKPTGLSVLCKLFSQKFLILLKNLHEYTFHFLESASKGVIQIVMVLQG